MKAFIIALAVLILITAFVLFCSFYLTKNVGELITEASRLPLVLDRDDFYSVYSSFDDKWLKIRDSLRYFAGHTESDRIEDALDDLLSRYETDDLSGYVSARKRLISELERVRKAEKITCDSLF